MELQRPEAEKWVQLRIGRRRGDLRESLRSLLLEAGNDRGGHLARRDTERAGDLADDHRVDQVDLAERVESVAVEREFFLVVGVIEAGGQRQPVGQLEIDRTEDRVGGVVEREELLRERPGTEDRVLRQSQRELDPAERARPPTAREQVEHCARLRAGGQRAVLLDRLVEVEPAEKEVERPVEVGCQPHFLREGVERLVADFRDDVGAGEVDVLILEGAQFAIGGDRGQRDPAELDVALQAAAIALDLVHRQLVEEGAILEDAAGVGRAADREDQRRHRAVDDGADIAAQLVDLRIVADRAQAQNVVVEEELAADVVAVAVVDPLVEIDDLDIAIALIVAAVEREGDRLGQRARDVALEEQLVEIAVGRRDRAAELELRRTGEDRDHPRAGVLAEQRRLRSAQHFDAADIGEVADLAGRTRAENAVDEHADRGLDADIVVAIAEAADDEGGGRARLELVHPKRGGNRLQIDQVANFGALERFAGGHADRDRSLLQRLLALGRGDDDEVRGVLILKLFEPVIVLGHDHVRPVFRLVVLGLRHRRPRQRKGGNPGKQRGATGTRKGESGSGHLASSPEQADRVLRAGPLAAG